MGRLSQIFWAANEGVQTQQEKERFSHISFTAEDKDAIKSIKKLIKSKRADSPKVEE